MKTYAWKFIIPPNEWRPMKQADDAGETVQFSGCGAVVLAETQAQAKQRLHTWAAENGLDSRWVEYADIRRVVPVPGAVLMWSQT